MLTTPLSRLFMLVAFVFALLLTFAEANLITVNWPWLLGSSLASAWLAFLVP